MKDKLANVLRAGVAASLEADAMGHEITGQPCAFGFPGGGEIVEGIKLHPPTGDYGELSVDGPDGEYHPIELVGPVRMKYRDLHSLCVGLSRGLFLWEVELALAIIRAERRYDRMLAFPGQAHGVA